MGVHVLDTLVRPVTEIPAGQQAVHPEQIAMSAAGTAGGTALVLARLGAAVHTAGVVGGDSAGTFLLQLLADDGVDVSLVHRLDGVQTSASVLPIRPDGSRPALPVISASGYLSQHVPWKMFHNVDFLHLDGPEFFGPDTARDIARRAHEDGVVVTVDSLRRLFPRASVLSRPHSRTSTTYCRTTSRSSAGPAARPSRRGAADCSSSVRPASSPLPGPRRRSSLRRTRPSRYPRSLWTWWIPVDAEMRSRQGSFVACR